MKVTIKYDSGCEMMEILKGSVSIFYGNYWDFDKSPEGLKDFLEELGLKVSVVEANLEG